MHPRSTYCPTHFSCRLSTFARPVIGDNGIDGGLLSDSSAADLAPRVHEVAAGGRG